MVTVILIHGLLVIAIGVGIWRSTEWTSLRSAGLARRDSPAERSQPRPLPDPARSRLHELRQGPAAVDHAGTRL